MLAAATDRSELDAVACSAVFTVLGRDGERTVDADELRRLTLTDLMATRRPASHSRMRNYIGKLAAPDGRGSTHAVWFESRNELEHLRDLMLSSDAPLLSTQTVRVVWPLPGGERVHYPDFTIEHRDGHRRFVEVKSHRKLLDPEVLAQFTLMSATAAHLGWGFEVRTELPAQRVSTQSHIFACRHAHPVDHELLAHRIRHNGGAMRLRECADVLGGGPEAVGAVLTLIAHRALHIDFNQPLDPDALVHLSPIQSKETSWLHQF